MKTIASGGEQSNGLIQSDASRLKDSECRLIIHAVHDASKGVSEGRAIIRLEGQDKDEIVREGFHYSVPLGRPVYWRMVKRGPQNLYVSTFKMSRQEVLRGWGSDGLVHCDPITGTAVVSVENFSRDHSGQHSARK